MSNTNAPSLPADSASHTTAGDFPAFVPSLGATSSSHDDAAEGLWRLTSDRLLAYGHTFNVRSSSTSRIRGIFPGRSAKQLERYMNDQDHLLEEFKKLDELLMTEKLLPTAAEAEADAAASKWEAFAINISNVANFAIFLATVFVAALSGSLALIASALDSFLDLMSGLILWFTSWKMRKPSPHTYPIGKQRMQPVGILVFSTIMASLGLQVAIISIEKLITQEKQVDLEGHKGYLTIIIMGASIVIMFALAVYCQSFKSKLVKAYADDHFFDGLTNVVGLASAILAAKFRWWIDPVGALLVRSNSDDIVWMFEFVNIADFISILRPWLSFVGSFDCMPPNNCLTEFTPWIF